MPELFPFPTVREKQDELLEECRDALEKGENVVAHAPTGIGKCVAGDTKVLTNEGLKEISEFENSQYLSCNSFDQDLKNEVSQGYLVEKKEAETLELSTGTGREIRVTEDHKMLRLKKGEVEWVRSENLDKGDYIASPRKIKLPENEFSLTLADLESEDLRVSTVPSAAKILEDFGNCSDRDLEEETGVPRKNLTRMRRNELVRLEHIVSLIENSDCSLDDFNVEKIAKSNKNTINLPDIDRDFCYFLGMMSGDGSLLGKKELIGFSTGDEECLEFFEKMMSSFDSNVRETHDDDYMYKSSNRTVAWLLNHLGIPKGKKKDLRIPQCVFTSEDNLSAFLSGLLDTDGGVDKQPKVEFTTKSENLSQELLIAFSVFGIRPTRTTKEVDGKEYYRLFISNKRELRKLEETIGFRIERKSERLKAATKGTGNENLDLIPECSNLIHKARKNSDISYSRKQLRRRLESYEYGRRKPTRSSLREILDSFDFKSSERTRFLRKLTESDVFWDRIEKISKKDKEPVYDITVPKNHNFSGNNFVLHNTAATITPALEYAKTNNKKVLFLTPRHSQHQIAVDTVKKIQERHDEELTVVDLLGKKWLCNIDGVQEMTSGDFMDYCQTLRDEERCDFYTAMYDMDEHKIKGKAKKKLDDLEGKAMHSEEFKEATPTFCPYYMMMELSRRSDLIVADYFHVFHPGVRESIFERANVTIEDTILIVDEAHNLPSRTRSLFSYSMSIPQIDRAMTEAEKFGFYEEEEYLERLKGIVTNIAADKFQKGSHEEKITKKALKDSISNFENYTDLVIGLEAVAEEVREEQERSYCGSVAEFLENWNGEDNGFFRCIKRSRSASGNRYIEIKYSCLDPQVSTKEPLNDCHSSILMSGTLTPQKMYVDLLGLKPEETRTRAFSSPFPEENQKQLLVPTVTTKYSERDDSMRQKYAWYLAKAFESVPGNVAVFFPSYSMMQKVRELLFDRTDRQIFSERRDMNKEDKQVMLNKFAARKEQGDAALLGVTAGSFGEGVDYPGEIMKAVFICGLPLQRPDLETKGLINFLDYKFNKGWDYGYSYPAMNRAIQAAGRCIRSKTDKGVIVYMDERYGWSNYRKVFPPDYKLKKTRAPWKEIDEFFSE